MSVTFYDYGTHSVGTTPGQGGTPTDASQLLVSRFTASEIDFNLTQSGVTYTLAFTGQFDVASVGFTPLTLADLENTNLGLSSKLTGFVVSQGGTYMIAETFTPAISFNDFSPFSDQTLAGLTKVLSGNDVYYTSSDASFAEGANDFFAFAGNDTYYENHKLLKYNDLYYGGDGLDTAVLPGQSTNYTIQASNTVWNELDQMTDLPGYYISDNTGAVNTLQVNQVERLSFTDTMVALDTGANQTAGNAYLLYQAAFNRTPDTPGLGYWIAQMDKGANVVTQVAENFILGNEFKGLYGSSPTVDQFTNLLYVNVLHRSADAAGLKYWEDQFAGTGFNLLTQAQTLNNFAISNENQANAATQIAQGIHYQAYVG